MSESRGYSIRNNTFIMSEQFEYCKDILIKTAITGRLNDDAFGNKVYDVVVYLNNQRVGKFLFNKLSIYPKNSQLGGTSIQFFLDTFENSFLGLLHDIQTSLHNTVEAYNKAHPDDMLPEYYGDFDFTSPKWIEGAAEYEKKNKKPCQQYTRGFSATVYFTKNLKVLSKIIKYYKQDGSFTYLTNPATRLDMLEVRTYAKFRDEITKGIDLPKAIYGKTIDQLSKMSDDELKDYGTLITLDSFVETFTRKSARVAVVSIGKLKATSKSKYGSFKLLLDQIAVEDKLGGADESLALLEAELAAQDINERSKSEVYTAPLAEPNEEDFNF